MKEERKTNREYFKENQELKLKKFRKDFYKFKLKKTSEDLPKIFPFVTMGCEDKK